MDVPKNNIIKDKNLFHQYKNNEKAFIELKNLTPLEVLEKTVSSLSNEIPINLLQILPEAAYNSKDYKKAIMYGEKLFENSEYNNSELIYVRNFLY